MEGNESKNVNFNNWSFKTKITLYISNELTRKTNYGKQRLFYQCAKEWKTLDASFKGMNSFLIFKQNIKSYIF